MSKKISLLVIICSCLFFVSPSFADDGSLKLDSDIITNPKGNQTNKENKIEAKYAPNLFLNRTNKVIEQQNQTNQEMLGSAKDSLFQGTSNSIYKLDIRGIKAGLFQDYQVEESFSLSAGAGNQWQGPVNDFLVSLFFLSMIIMGIYLGRKWHGLRKNRSDSRV